MCIRDRDYITAGIGSAIVFLILLVLGRIKNESRMLLIVRGARSTDKRIMSVVSEYFSRRIDLRVENTTEQTVELIYEIPLKIFEKASNRAESIADCLYAVSYTHLASDDYRPLKHTQILNHKDGTSEEEMCIRDRYIKYCGI